MRLHEWLDVCESAEHKVEYVDGPLFYLDVADIEHRTIQACLCERVCLWVSEKSTHLSGVYEVKVRVPMSEFLKL